jgi:hypothetical protein
LLRSGSKAHWYPLQQSLVETQLRSSQVPEASVGVRLASSGVSVASFFGLVASFFGLVGSLGSCEVPEGGAVLVLSTSPPGDVYWLTHAQSEPPTRVIRNKEQNVI